MTPRQFPQLHQLPYRHANPTADAPQPDLTPTCSLTGERTNTRPRDLTPYKSALKARKFRSRFASHKHSQAVLTGGEDTPNQHAYAPTVAGENEHATMPNLDTDKPNAETRNRRQLHQTGTSIPSNPARKESHTIHSVRRHITRPARVSRAHRGRDEHQNKPPFPPQAGQQIRNSYAASRGGNHYQIGKQIPNRPAFSTPNKRQCHRPDPQKPRFPPRHKRRIDPPSRKQIKHAETPTGQNPSKTHRMARISQTKSIP